MLGKRFTEWLADMAVQRRRIVIALFATLAVAGLVLSAGLEVTVEPEDLLAEDNETGQRFFEVSDRMGMTQSLVVAVEGTDRAAMVDAAHTVVDRIESDEELAAHFRAIHLKADAEYPLQWALMLAEEPDDIADLQRLLEQRSLIGFLTVFNDTLEDLVMDGDDEFTTNQDEWDGLAAMAGFERLAGALGGALNGEPTEASDEIVESVFAGAQYNWSPDEQMLLFSLFPSYSYMDDLDVMRASVEGVAAVAEDVERDFSGVDISVGGEVAWGIARHDGVSADMLIPTLVALVLIVVLFFFSFTRFRNIMLALLALVVGIIISTGAIALTIGHISMITAIFAVILLGLGIDFGIHLISNYDDFRLAGEPPSDAIRRTMSTTGTPILLGGVTTACAFFALMVSSSPAIFEFGVATGMGVLITLITMLLFLPAMIMAFGSKAKATKSHWKPMIDFSFMAAFGRRIQRHPYIAVTAAVALTIVGAVLIPRNIVDYDPMRNSPRNHPITQTQQRIIDTMKISPFTSMSIRDSVEEVRELSERFREQRLVAQVISAADFLPPEEEVEERLAMIAAGGPAGPGGADDVAGLGPGDGRSERTPDDIERLAYEIQRLEWNVIEMGDLAVAGLGEENMLVQRRDAMIREILGAEVGEPGREVFQSAIRAVTEDPEEAAVRLEALDAAFGARLAELQEHMAVDRTPAVADIPANMRDQFVSTDGTHFLAMVVPTAETQEGSHVIHEFHSVLTAIDRGITGSVPVYVALVNEIFTEAAQAAVYVAIVVFVLLLLIFRRLVHVILAFVMVTLGFVWMFGLLPLTGTHLALTAGLVLPLIIGIGTDDAMHILHRYRHEGERIEPTLRYSGKAVLLTSITTMLGFGSLAVVGEMATIAAIGWLLFVGIGTCFLATVIVLPATLELGNRWASSRPRVVPSDEGQPAVDTSGRSVG